MKPRDARLALDLYTGAVIVSVATALAGLTWQLLGNPGVSPAAAPVVARAGIGEDIAPVVALAPFGVSVTAPPAGAASSAVLLRGVLMATPPEASVALIETDAGVTGSYGIGATVGGGVIEAIRADEVAIRTASGLRILAFAPAGGPGAPRPAAGMAPAFAAPSGAQGLVPAPPAGPVSPAAPADPSTATPPRVGAGYVVSAAPGPQLTAAGLKPGDLVLQINGTPVGSETNGTDALSRAASLGQATIELIRDGRRVSLTVPIR